MAVRGDFEDVLDFKPLGGVDGVNYEFETSGPPVVLHKGGKASKEPRGLVGPVLNQETSL